MLNSGTKDQEQSLPNATDKDMQAQIAEQMMGIFDFVITDRSNYYKSHPDKRPNPQSVPSIIKACSTTNAAISGGASLVPGPFGMIAVIPEIIAVIRNQLVMIYDIGEAYGKSRTLTKELLAGILMTALGAGAGSLLLMQGSKVLVKRVTLRAFQQIVVLLAGKVTQQMLKSMISKWLPVVGAAAMAAWSNYLTRQVGKKAIEVFEKEIEVSNDFQDLIDVEMINSKTSIVETFNPSTSSAPSTLDKIKIQSLINLVKIDGSVKDEECSYLQIVLENADLSEEDRLELVGEINSSQKFHVDYSLFSSYPDDAISLLSDLVALAKRDGQFHITEKMYIKQVGKLMGFSGSDIEEAMATT